MKMIYELKKTKNEVIIDASAAIATSGLNDIENERLLEVERQFTTISNRLNAMAQSAMNGNADIYEATVRQLTYEQGILQTEWEGLMEKKQETTAMEKQLKVLIELLDGLEEEQESNETDEGESNFRDDIFLQIIERGFMHSEGEVDFELKCGITRTTQAFMRATKKKLKKE